jgi:serine/threonine protein kinase
MPWCLTVVDGADLKRVFPLPAEGKIAVGKDPLQSRITFNDFYLEKAHCTLEVEEEGLTVHDTSQERGVFVNGKKVVRHATVYAGDVVRVGNTYLRLDPYDGPPPETPDDDEDERRSIPLFSLKRLGDLQTHTLGHYELGLLLGKGQHGVVFRARDLVDGKTVALKVLSPDFPQDVEEIRKFARVVKSLVALGDHPGLVHWLGTGKVGPYVWIAQEFIEGENLKSMFTQPESTRWSWRGAWRLAWEIGHALEHLRSREIAHGNITWANVLVAGDGRVRLNDLLFQEAIDGSVLQKQQMEKKLLAELPFMPPERLDAEAFVDPHVADLYSLGVATYVRLSSGALPLAGDTPEETIELIREGVSDKHRRRAPAAPENFLDIVYKMIARKQEDRYQTPAQLLADLEPFNEKR